MNETNYKYPAVMLIDDNDIDNYVHERLMNSVHFAKNIYHATGARSALEFIDNMNRMGETFKTVYPRVIFIDINMPVMNGFEFIQFFEKNSEKHLLMPKLVILTSSVNKKDKLLALEASENILFLHKPLTVDMLDTI